MPLWDSSLNIFLIPTLIITLLGFLYLESILVTDISNKIPISYSCSNLLLQVWNFILLSFVKISKAVVMNTSIVYLYFLFLPQSLTPFLFSSDLPKISLFYWTKEPNLLVFLVNCCVFFLFHDECLLISLIIPHTLSLFLCSLSTFLNWNFSSLIFNLAFQVNPFKLYFLFEYYFVPSYIFILSLILLLNPFTEL